MIDGFSNKKQIPRRHGCVICQIPLIDHFCGVYEDHVFLRINLDSESKAEVNFFRAAQEVYLVSQLYYSKWVA
jgi:hypothetical protein